MNNTIKNNNDNNYNRKQKKKYTKTATFNIHKDNKMLGYVFGAIIP